MTEEQKARMLSYVQIVQVQLQRLADGQDDQWERHLDLATRRERADWQLNDLLQDLLEILPQDLRANVQACVEINQRIWSAEYREGYYKAQEKASPSCLAALDSL